MKELIKLINNIEKKIGYSDWDELKDSLGRLHNKIKELEDSREKWKQKFFELQLENEQLKRELK